MKTVDQITTEAKAVIQTADVAIENFADEVRRNALTALLASEGVFVAATDRAVWKKVLDFLATPEVVVLTTPEMNKKVIGMCIIEVMRDERLVAYPATNLVVRETKAAWQRVYHFMVRGW